MFTVIERVENLRTSTARHKNMVLIDELIKGRKEFILSECNDRAPKGRNKKAECIIYNTKGEVVVTFHSAMGSFGDAVRHIYRQAVSYKMTNYDHILIETGEREMELKDRMIYETSCIPKRKDHREKQEEWCRKIDEITPDINYYKFYKNTPVRLGYIVECQVTNYKGEGGTRTYISRQNSCIDGLRDIYKQIRDML